MPAGLRRWSRRTRQSWPRSKVSSTLCAVIGKIIAGSSFGATVDYVMKEQSRILGFEGIEPPGVSDMARDFKDQTLLNPRIKNAVGHISLSFSPKDADRLTDPVMAQIAREYMERMEIRNTQYLIVRHTDQAHPHCHIVYNRVGNNGQTISDKNIKIRNGKVCKELTAKYGLYYPKGKEQVRHERLREPDKTKHQIYDAIRGCLPGCKSWPELVRQLQERGITTKFKYCGNTDRRQGVLFGMNGYTFSGSKIDRAFSFSKLDRLLAGTPDRYSRHTAPLFGAGGREFIHSGRSLSFGVHRAVRQSR